MKTVFLADDDLLSLNHIETLINWHEHGYEIIGRATNGGDCIQALKLCDVDILILDIDMPVLNGVEVCKQLSSAEKTPKILIISNYDSFQFVRDAMRYGAVNYLLKHQITSTSLLNELGAISSQTEKESVNTQQINYFASVAKRNFLYNNIINFEQSNIETNKFMQTQKEFCGDCFFLLVLQIPNFTILQKFSSLNNSEKTVRSVISLCENFFAKIGNGIITYIEFGFFAVLFSFNDNISVHTTTKKAISFTQQLIANIEKYMGIICFGKTSNILSSYKKLNKVYNELFLEIAQIEFDQERHTLSLIEQKDLNLALSLLNFSRVEDVLKDIFSRCEKGKNISQQMLAQLLEISLLFCKTQKISSYAPSQLLYSAYVCTAIKRDEIEKLLLEYFHYIITTALGTENLELNDKASNYVQKICVFIRENYNKDIFLDQLAQNLNVSAGHLSRVLKQQTGATFIEKLNEFRISKADELMKYSNLSLKEIAQKVGFNGYSYFLQSYKKATGKTAANAMNSYRNTP